MDIIKDSNSKIPDRIKPLFDDNGILLADSHKAFVMRVFDDILTAVGGDKDRVDEKMKENFFWIILAYKLNKKVNRDVYKALSNELEDYLEKVQREASIA